MPEPDLAACLAMLEPVARDGVEAIASALGLDWYAVVPLRRLVVALAVERMADDLEAAHPSFGRAQARREAAAALGCAEDSARVAGRVRRALERYDDGQNVQPEDQVA